MKTENNKREFNWNTAIAVTLGILTVAVIVVCVLLCIKIPETYMRDYEIISLMISAYGSLSLVLLVIQLVVAKNDSRARHDEKRREKTVDYMIKWSDSLRWETTYAVRIVEGFNHEQCANLYNKQPFEVNFETKKELCPICSSYKKSSCKKCFETTIKPENMAHDCHVYDKNFNDSSSRMYTIDVVQCNEIRWYIIQYLNFLEALLISWKQGIVDRDIIEEQFYFLYDPDSGKDALQSFRNAAGKGKSYPTIEEFCLELRNNKQQTNIKMKEIL